jgi:hypothetical protein
MVLADLAATLFKLARAVRQRQRQSETELRLDVEFEFESSGSCGAVLLWLRESRDCPHHAGRVPFAFVPKQCAILEGDSERQRSSLSMLRVMEYLQRNWMVELGIVGRLDGWLDCARWFKKFEVLPPAHT